MKADEVPSQPFDPFEPSAERPWDLARVSHLYRRVAFGADWKTLQSGVKAKPGDLVDRLVDFDPADDPFNDTLESLTGLVDVKEPQSIRNWWVHRILNTPRPLQERMALVWHDHFATSVNKVGQGQLMHQQIELFRQKGLGSFRDLVIAVGRDPAMLIWLDGRESKKGKPNENYAREIMELFTLGVGNYSEADVKELSRCFTGWSIKDGEGFYNAKQWDDGEKTILGQTGKFTDEQAVDLLLSQPAASKFLSRKLLEEFVHPKPDEKLVEEFAGRIVKAEWKMDVVLRDLFKSRVFFSDYAYRSRIKSPAELTMSLAVAMGGKIKTQFVVEQMNKMGQALLAPPDVAGWDGNEAWINSNTYIVRMNYGWALAQSRDQDYARRSSIENAIKAANVKSASDVIDFFANLLLDGSIPDTTRTELMTYLDQDDKGKPRPFDATKQGGSKNVRSVLRILTAIPEFQLA